MPGTRKSKPCSILVNGDVVLDHHIYCGGRDHPAALGDGTRILRQRGGAGQTANLLDALCRDEPLLDIYDATPPVAKGAPTDPGIHHSFATWSAFPPKKGDKKKKVWRVDRTFGFGNVEIVPEPARKKIAPPNSTVYDVVVIDEGGLGFRHDPGRWPDVLGNRRKIRLPWIVLKMSHPVCQGELWTRLLQDRLADRLIVIVAAADLRLSGASISKGLSWEQSVRELLGDLKFHSDISKIARARHIIVNFGHDGALWIDNSNRRMPKRQLVFDPGHLEGTWQEGLDGSVLGAGACLPVSVARSLFETVDQESGRLRLAEKVNLVGGIARGLMARRVLLESGHGTIGTKDLGFPYGPVVKALNGETDSDMDTAQVPKLAIPGGPGVFQRTKADWSIIAGNPTGGYRPLFGRARKVAINGEAALGGIPFGSFGKLYTVDHIELNNFYGIRKLMIDYLTEKKPGKPLSLGVFGPPGSGKSFGIKQIARGILGKTVPILTFNLSQFSGPDMLIGALHQVRDEVLRGEIPVVFWDEFDSNKLFWLQYMLAPMNDGEFLEGQVTHPVGKCIFIFAGGTSHSLEAFSAQGKKSQVQAFVDAKGPDFVSRLKGYLNVLGPNPRKVGNRIDPSDVGYPIRRAIMLRVHAGHFKSKRMSIDPGLLNAMLKIGEFKHGARSMATIVNLITGGGKRPLLRCNLPPREQLGLHVDYDEFLGLVHESTMFKLKAEELAPHIHRFYLDLGKKMGWKKPKYSMPYAKLPEVIKQDNIAAATRLPDVLSLVGLMVVDSRHGPGADAEKVKNIIEENINILAEAEHNGWMEFKLANNWRLAEERDDDKKRHPSLKLFKKLDVEDQEKDRDAVRNYPEIVKRAGFLIRLEGK